MRAVQALRDAIVAGGLTCLGEPSPIVPVMVGRTPVARVASGLFMRGGVFANLVEYPAVGLRAARFRMQVQADHTPEEARAAATIVLAAVAEARQRLGLSPTSQSDRLPSG